MTKVEETIFLSLSSSGQLSEFQAQWLADNEAKLRDSYTEFIGQLALANKIQGVCWLLGTTSRDPFASQLLSIFFKLSLLTFYLEAGFRKFEILVDSKGQKDVALKALKPYTASAKISYTKNTVRETLSSRIVRTVFSAANSVFWPRLYKGRWKPKTSMLLFELSIDGRVQDDPERHINHYYQGLLDSVEDSVKDRCWFFVLTISGLSRLKDYRQFWRSIRQSPNNYIFKEDWLRSRDFCWAIVKSVIIPFCITTSPHWQGIDVARLVIQDARSAIGSRRLYESLLAYRVIKRLREGNLDLTGVIDWSENQVIDRALCLGLRRWFPEVHVKGYQGYFVPEMYLNHEIADYEYYAETTPHEILVISPLLREQKKKYCPPLRVSIAPALRFLPERIQRSSSEGQEGPILVGLPIQPDYCSHILKCCFGLPGNLKSLLTIKPHPFMEEKLFESLMKQAGLPLILRLGESAKTDEVKSKASFLISVGSSLCAEAVNAGIRVAIVGSKNSVPMNPLQHRVSNSWWRLCFSSEEITNFYQESRDGEMEPPELFVPVTKSTINKMVSFV